MSRRGSQGKDGLERNARNQLSLESLSSQVADYEGIDPKALHAYNELTRTARALVTELDRAGDGAGLSSGRNLVLWCVMTHGGKDGPTPAELADTLNVRRASVTGLLNALESDGLIVRKRSKEDLRKVHLRISAKAKKLIATEWPRASRNITLAFSRLSASDKMTLVDLLRKLRAGLPELRKL
jgi:DNA-binding MarR family transcriptional regulator